MWTNSSPPLPLAEKYLKAAVHFNDTRKAFGILSPTFHHSSFPLDMGSMIHKAYEECSALQVN